MKTKYRFGLLISSFFIISFLATTGNVYGQGLPNDSLRVEFDEIVVESTHSSITMDRAPLSVSYRLRDAREIAARPASTMDELAYTLPGIFISNRENYALGERLTIRGLGWRSQFGVRGVQVILDDIPLTVADGQTIMNMVDPAMINRIELLRGPSATFWGNSSGGVLHLSTKPAIDAPILQYRGYAGSYSTLKQELRWNTHIGNARVFGYGTYFETDGFRDHSAARAFRGGLNMEMPLGNRNRIQLRSAFTSMPKAQHPGALTKEDSKTDPTAATPSFVSSSAGKWYDQAMFSAIYIHEFTGGIWNVTAHTTYRDVDNPLPFGYIGVDRVAGGARTTYEFTELPFDLNLGGEVKFQRDDRLETDNVNGVRGDQIDVQQTETVSNGALFTRLATPLNDRLTVSMGVRADWLQFNTDDDIGTDQEGARTFFSVNPSAGVSYRFDQARWFLNFSTSFESPTTTELVNRPEGGNGFNQNVDPERAISLESGIQGQKSRFEYDFTLFAMQVRDLLFPYQLEDFGPTYFKNQGNTRHLGFESTLGYRVHRSIYLRAMLTYLDAVFDGGEFDGNKIPGVTPARFGSTITFSPGQHYLSLDTQWIDRYYTNNDNSESNAPYSLLNFRWSVELENLFKNSTVRPFISVKNLLNTRYNSSVGINAYGGRYFEPGSDRNVQVGIQVSLL